MKEAPTPFSWSEEVTRPFAAPVTEEAVGGPAAHQDPGLAPEEADETLIVDDRSGLSPAQMVETKLANLLRGATLPVSHLQMRGLLRGRGSV
jgi:hypothetical protein